MRSPGRFCVPTGYRSISMEMTMADNSPRLDLPYILPSQAQKHVTHNEALLVLDAVTQLVIEGTLATPPASPAAGSCYWVAATATDAWAGKEAHIAAWQDDSWAFLAPAVGWRAYFRTTGQLQIYDGTDWQDLALPATASFSRLGINATADDTNRLAVSSDAVLLNHAGGDNRLKLNKAGESNTATLLYQSNWQGRAEMGLAGSDQFSIKVCNDSGSWTTALLISGDGTVTQPARPAARAELTSPSLAVTGGMVTGFNGLVISQGNMLLATATASGNGQSLKVPVAGLYLITLTLSTTATNTYTAIVVDSAQTSLAKIIVGTTTIATETHATALIMLDAGAEISLLHNGTATFASTGAGAKFSIFLI
ncbi:DUF2793 domain-containing protein [Agrobacterium vitis]|nr:DUF2793 domain-containing protein [Agrobacterium vitis]MUO71368.1 DUF2793 domain-containing protein [Agrobacterium vitis]MUO85125.1 DUF2793 domain-containing protein [Agrobacterium vitis]MVA34336.1 DUF2793 domain-containing protein [Agrobacterium vitis]